MIKKYSSDKGMQKLFESFRRSLHEIEGMEGEEPMDSSSAAMHGTHPDSFNAALHAALTKAQQMLDDSGGNAEIQEQLDVAIHGVSASDHDYVELMTQVIQGVVQQLRILGDEGSPIANNIADLLSDALSEKDGLSETNFLSKGGVFDHEAWWDSLSDEKKAKIKADTEARNAAAAGSDKWATSGEKPWRSTDKEPKI